MEPVKIPLRKKYLQPNAAKNIKKTKAGNGRRDADRKFHGSFTHCPPGSGDGKK